MTPTTSDADADRDEVAKAIRAADDGGGGNPSAEDIADAVLSALRARGRLVEATSRTEGSKLVTTREVAQQKINGEWVDLPAPSPAAAPSGASFGDEQNALIRLMRSVQTREPGHYVDLADIARLILSAGYRRAAASPAEAGGWIACSDKQPPDETLPEREQDWPTVYLTMPHWRQVSYFDGCWREFNNDQDAWQVVRPQPTHWRPLPPAPAQAGEGVKL